MECSLNIFSIVLRAYQTAEKAVVYLRRTWPICFSQGISHEVHCLILITQIKQKKLKHKGTNSDNWKQTDIGLVLQDLKFPWIKWNPISLLISPNYIQCCLNKHFTSCRTPVLRAVLALKQHKLLFKARKSHISSASLHLCWKSSIITQVKLQKCRIPWKISWKREFFCHAFQKQSCSLPLKHLPSSQRFMNVLQLFPRH